MANKVILDVDIDDTAFQEFKRKFDEYGAALKTLPAQWAASNTAIATTRTAFEKAASDLVRTGDRAQGLAKAAGDAGKIADVTAATWAGMATSGKLFHGHVHHATQHLMRWSKLTAVFSGIIGAGGLFGINRMAASVAGQRTSAMGLGVSYGEQASFLTNFGRLGNAEGILTGFSQVEAAVNKTALRQYLGRDPSGDPAADFAAGLGKFKEFVDKTPHELLGPMLQARGYDQLGLGVEQANTVRGMSRAEVDQLAGSYRGDLASRLALSDADAKKWTNFTTQMERAGGEIQATFAKGAVQLTPSLTRLSDSFVKFADHMLVEGGPVAGLVKKFGKGVDSFADTIDSGAFQASVRTFIRNCGDAVKLFESFASAAPDLVGIALAARVGGGAAVAAGTALARSGALGVLGRGAGVVLGPAGALAAGGLAVSPSPTNEDIPESERQRRFHQGSFAPEHMRQRHIFGHPYPRGVKGALRYFNEGGQGPFPQTSQGLNVPLPHPAQTEHERRVRRIFAHPAHRWLTPGAAQTGAAELGTPWNHEYIHLSGGAAQRSNSLSGMQPSFRARLEAMFRDAPAGASVFSGYRSPALQAQLFNRSDRSGHMVARPGHSHHGMGDAADIRGDLAWFHKHAAEYGLRFPMPYENWHIQSDPSTTVPVPASSRRHAFGHHPHIGHHPATIGRAQHTLTIEDHTGGLVTVTPH